MIKIEFPADRADIALAMAQALHRIATGVSLDEVTRTERLGATNAVQGVDAVLYVGTTPVGAAQPVATVVQTAAGHVDTQTGEVVELDQPANPGDAMRLDLKGVAFDPRYCANAQDPFYASGKESGQWKAKRGLAAGVYEQWYAQQLAASTTQAAPATEETDPTPPVATATAFGAAQQQQVAAPVMRTAGELMAWVSEKQVAGRLTQAVIDDAYRQLGIRVQDLFVGTEAVIANNVAALYNYLAPTAGA